MTGGGGGCYPAEDADSIPPEDVADEGMRGSSGPGMSHKKEGAYYLWRADEVDALLGGDARAVKLRFGIEPEGNAPQDPQQEFTGKNLLYVARSIDEIAKDTGTPPDDVVESLQRTRLTMFKQRLGRPRPGDRLGQARPPERRRAGQQRVAGGLQAEQDRQLVHHRLGPDPLRRLVLDIAH